MQIRRLISQSEKNRRHRGDSDPVDPGTVNNNNNNKTGNGGHKNSRRNIENKNRNQTRSVHAKMVTHEEGEVVGRGNAIVIANKAAEVDNKPNQERRASEGGGGRSRGKIN